MILIINGPNLNLLGSREPEIYGTESFESYLEKLRMEFPHEEIEYFQSNSEGEIIDAVQAFGCPGGAKNGVCRGVIINPGAYTHYSIAIADAIGACTVPVVEVHISNIHAREDYRRRSVTASRARGLISGLGLPGYRLAILSLL